MYFILGLFIGALMVYSYYSTQPEKIIYKTPLTKRQEKLVALFGNKAKVSNSQIRKNLKLSDATITRELDKLEELGEIKQIGKTGRAVYYTKV